MTWVEVDDEIYFVDDLAEIAVAQEAMREAGLAEVKVNAGDPDCPDSYRNGQVLFAE